MRFIVLFLISFAACKHHTDAENIAPAAGSKSSSVQCYNGENSLDLSREGIDPNGYTSCGPDMTTYRVTLSDSQRHFISCPNTWPCQNPNFLFSLESPNDTPMCVDMQRCCDDGLVPH